MGKFSINAMFFSWCYGLFASTFVFVGLLIISFLADRADVFLAWIVANFGLVVGGIVVSGAILGFILAVTALDSNV